MAADLAAGVQQMLATADPTLGRVLRWTHQNGARVVGRFMELAPHRRIVVTCGWEDGRLSVPPSTTVEIDLVEQGERTTVRLVHHGLPPWPWPATSGDGLLPGGAR
jgi:uncharacterized protein YndB with AHSA1/START domain